MASLSTSELQFAFTFFAKFNDLYNYSFNKIIVPSTIMEGKDDYEYNGADLVIDQYFFQFKTSEILINSNAGQKDVLGTPYFRFDIKNLPTESSRRGQLHYLIDHANDRTFKKEVFYVAPSFEYPTYSHKPSAAFWYNNFYKASSSDLERFCSFFDISSINPSWVGQNDDHIICYKHGDPFGYLFSEPREIKRTTQVFPEINIGSYMPKDLPTIDIITETMRSSLTELVPQGRWENEKGNDVAKAQKIMLEHFDILWFPLIINNKDVKGNKINSVLNSK